MRKLSIGVKIGGGFLSVGLILLISGATSYWVINTLNQALSNITGPALDSMVAAESGIQSVQKQLLAVDSLLIRGRNIDVTDKVRELDELASNSLQEGAAQANNVIRAARTNTEASVDPANQARKSLTEVAKLVAEISGLNQRIARSAESQNITVTGVDKSIIKINEVSTRTSAGALELSHSTQELSSLASDLQGLVGQFKV